MVARPAARAAASATSASSRRWRTVPRDAFVPERERGAAYADGPLPIGAGQTISQPYIVARMTELLAVGPGDRVLEIGTGSGYQAACWRRSAACVTSIERDPDLALDGHGPAAASWATATASSPRRRRQPRGAGRRAVGRHPRRGRRRRRSPTRCASSSATAGGW